MSQNKLNLVAELVNKHHLSKDKKKQAMKQEDQESPEDEANESPAEQEAEKAEGVEKHPKAAKQAMKTKNSPRDSVPEDADEERQAQAREPLKMKKR